MDAISKAAEKQVPLQEISGMLAATLTKCVACHGAWELKIKE
jgi:cytochrome c553